jgi:uracil-DNA glycosylase family 4
MNTSEELAELLHQTQEHLRYYQELGVTHLESLSAPLVAAPPAAPRVTADESTMPPSAPGSAPGSAPTSAPGSAQTSPPNRAPAPVARPEAKVPEPVTLPTLSPPPAAILPSMAKKVVAAELPSLFVEAEPQPPALPPQVYTSLEEIRADLGDCQRCKLWQTRMNIVFGEGSPQAELMFVGEAPGADEDATGRPFVGRAGQLLTKMIEAIELKREQVYIANVLKSRPPNNRNPEKDEIDACKPFLLGQIAVIKPKLIVTLGNPATQLLLETKVGITRLRGEVQDYPHLPGIKVIPTFHPAYLLRSPDKKREAWEDLKKVRAFLRGELQA